MQFNINNIQVIKNTGCLLKTISWFLIEIRVKAKEFKSTTT